MQRRPDDGWCQLLVGCPTEQLQTSLERLSFCYHRDVPENVEFLAIEGQRKHVSNERATGVSGLESEVLFHTRSPDEQHAVKEC